MKTNKEVIKQNINDLLEEDKVVFMKNEFEKESFFEKLYGNQSQVKLQCNEFYKRFHEKIKDLLVAKGIVSKVDFPLEELHLNIPSELREYNFNDGVNKISTFFYENDQDFQDIYLDFVKNFLKKEFDFPFYFQKTPTIRLHCPNAKNSSHYPRYHTDIGYGHPPQEINFWFSLTKPVGNQEHGFRLANIKDSLAIYRKYDYNFNNLIRDAINDDSFTKNCNNISPQSDTKEGEILVFDSRCIHTGEPMVEHTRISMDIRIISVEEYNKIPIIYQGAGRRKILFAPGDCYHELNSNQL